MRTLELDVVAIDGKGIYVTDGEKAWCLVTDSQLQQKSDTLADLYDA